MTIAFAAMAPEFTERGERLSFIINREYGDCIKELIAIAPDE